MSTAAAAFWRPLDRADKRRLRQVSRYLAAHWPTPFPVELRFERLAANLNCVAETYRRVSERRLILRIDSRACRSWAIDLLLHEWAHLVVWPAAIAFEKRQERNRHPAHPPEWRALHGEIIAAMDDGKGLEDSEDW